MEEVALALLLLSACDGEPVTFGDREFLFESIDGYELLPGTFVRLRFSDEYGVSAWGGCNAITADRYELSGGKLSLHWLGMTELGCEPAGRHEQDEWLMAFLQASPSFVLEEPRLTLADGQVTLVLIDSEVADPDRTLEGRVWDVAAVIDGAVAGAGITSREPTLEFRDDGSLAIMTACAPGRGTYRVDGDSIVLTDVTIDDVACLDDEYLEFSMRYDEIMRGVLADGVVEFEIDAGRLTMTRGDIGLYLTTD